MAEFKTLHFMNTSWGQKEKNETLAREKALGWRVVSETIVPGKFRGNEACCLFLLCAPLALTAGHHPDQITVTLERSTSSDERENAIKYDRQKWSALLLYDNEVASAAEQIKPLGQKWTDEFAAAYLALNDNRYLPSIVEKISNRAHLERQEAEARAAREQERKVAEMLQRQRIMDEQIERYGKWYPYLWGTPGRRTGTGIVVLFCVLAVLIVWAILSAGH